MDHKPSIEFDCTNSDERIAWAQISKEIDNLPNVNEEVIPGVVWGNCGVVFTPAYWKIQYHLFHENALFSIDYKLGHTLIEEIVACLLGGYGIKSEIATAAFNRFKERKLICEGSSLDSLVEALSEPFQENGKLIRYRFPTQKAKYIFKFLGSGHIHTVPQGTEHEFREWLLEIDGIGPKIASWITRNHLDSDNVAIIDIHIYRACRAMGLFHDTHHVSKDYFELEERFLQFCRALNVQASKMDALMWYQIRDAGSLLRFS